MKVLIINGSPKGKNSNTYKLTSSFVDGMKENAFIEVEELNVNTLNVNQCLGCFTCWSKTPGTCVYKDDTQMVIEKLLWADVTIWSFPLYYFSIPGKLKTLIDRELPMVLPFMVKDSESGSHPVRYDMTGKKNILISTCGFYKAEGNYDSVIAMFDRLFDKGNYEKIFCGQGELFRVEELKKRTNEYLSYVKDAGREYVSGSISQETRNNLDTLLFPKETFESMADASWGIEKDSGEKLDDSLIFTKQMAALYNKKSHKGKDIVLEMEYTDINKTYQIILKKDGHEVLTENFVQYTTKIETSFALWCDIASEKISGQEALMKQMYKVKGDFNLMIHWDDYFGGEKADTVKTQQVQKPAKTSMLLLLIPWIAFWIGPSIDVFIGSLVAIGVTALVPLVFHKFKKTIYDVISSVAVIGFSIMLLIGNSLKTDISFEYFILPASYLGFGLMWSISCLFKIPLTAYYSMNDYNGEKALENPLFIKTNRILTLLWGILYLITSVVNYFVMQTDFSIYLPIINDILPILLGIFTLWFQKWYPAKVARG